MRTACSTLLAGTLVVMASPAADAQEQEDEVVSPYAQGRDTGAEQQEEAANASDSREPGAEGQAREAADDSGEASNSKTADGDGGGGAQSADSPAPAPADREQADKTVSASRPAQSAAGEEEEEEEATEAGADPEQGTVGQQQKEEAEPSRSVQNVYREQGALFSDRLTLEPSLTYTRSDRRSLDLNGFLALDAIFLGNINVDREKNDTLTAELTARYGVTNRLEVSATIPYIYRHTRSETGGGDNGSGTSLIGKTVTDHDVGDVSFGLNYRLFREGPDNPDVVWNLRASAPTGREPYGIETVTVDPNENLTVREELPTGTGVWSLSSGFSVIKTTDPAILFASVTYQHNFEESFGDISSQAGAQPGRIDLGDSVSYGLGTAFALNPELSLSISYSQRFAFQTKQKPQGGSWSEVVGSEANSSSMNLGATYALNEHLNFVANIGIGMTPDAPDMSVNLKFPYTF